MRVIIVSVAGFLGALFLPNVVGKSAEELEQSYIREQIEAADEHLKKRELEPAIALLEKLSRRFPYDPNIWEVLGFAYSAARKNALAAVTFERVSCMGTEYQENSLYAAQTYEEIGDWNSASRCYWFYLDAFPKDSNAWKSLSHAERIQGHTMLALQSYLRSFNVTDKKPSPEEAVNIGEMFLEVGNPCQAKYWLNEALAENKNGLEVHLGLLRWAYNQKSWIEVAKEIAVVDGLDPEAIKRFNLNFIRNELALYMTLKNGPEENQNRSRTVPAEKNVDLDFPLEGKSEEEMLALLYDSAVDTPDLSCWPLANLDSSCSGTSPSNMDWKTPGKSESETKTNLAPAKRQTTDVTDLKENVVSLTNESKETWDDRTVGQCLKNTLQRQNQMWIPAGLNPLGLLQALAKQNDGDPVSGGQPKSSPLIYKNLLKMGQEALINGEMEKAIGYYRRAVTQDVMPSEAWYALSQAFFITQEWGKAELSILEALEREPSNLTFELHFLRIAQKKYPPQEFVGLLEKARVRFPNSPEIVLILGRAYETMAPNRSRAIDAYHTFLRIAPPHHPKKSDVQNSLARLLSRKN
jgi:tetratricopeptide (TPR) repeat protein